MTTSQVRILEFRQDGIDDYCTEMNVAQNAEAMALGSHPGYEATALEGLTLSLDVLNEKRIKVVINGGALNPKGLAERVQEMVSDANSRLLSILLHFECSEVFAT